MVSTLFMLLGSHDGAPLFDMKMPTSAWSVVRMQPPVPNSEVQPRVWYISRGGETFLHSLRGEAEVTGALHCQT